MPAAGGAGRRKTGRSRPWGAPLLGLLAILAIAGHPGFARAAAPSPQELVTTGGYLVKKGSAVVAEHNSGQRLMTASIFKIATAAAALRILGPEFHFPTSFSQDAQGDLFIKGWGDPALTSEEVAGIIASLRERGLKPVRRLLLDNSAFQLDQEFGGGSRNPYDAANSALAVNFNTVNLKITSGHRVESGEPQTPTLPLMAQLGRNLPPGEQRIAIPSQAAIASRYAGELFVYLGARQDETLFRPAAIVIADGAAPASLPPLYNHLSRPPLTANIAELLRYSNNFCANQIFLALGARRYGYPATWEKGKAALEDYLYNDLGIARKELVLAEGSGLSRENQATPEAMLKILEAFAPQAELLPRQRGRLVKSGTLTGVYSYAGYFPNPAGYDPFVLILNQPRNTRDQLLDRLEQIYRQAN